MTYHAPPVRPDPHPTWRNQARCRGVDPDIMFPHDIHGVQYAKQICADCPVRNACLNYALTAGEHCGVWGGKSERERRNMLRRRRAA